MSDTTERDAVLKEFSEVGGLYINIDAIVDDVLHLRDERQRLLTENAALRAEAERLRALATSDWNIAKAHAKERQRLTAAVWRVRALHEPIAKDIPKCVVCKDYSGYHVDHPCPTLRALEDTTEFDCPMCWRSYQSLTYEDVALCLQRGWCCDYCRAEGGKFATPPQQKEGTP